MEVIEMKFIRNRRRGLLALALTAVVALVTALSFSARQGETQSKTVTVDESRSTGRYCTATASAMFKSCGFEAQDSYWKAVAVCTNISDSGERAQCLSDARDAREVALEKCEDQFEGRQDNCRDIGEGRYELNLNPANFITDFQNPPNPNPYFPLRVGYRWDYSGGDETATTTVSNERKLIGGVTAAVIKDRVFINGDLTEDTDDWYALALNADVYYLGEEVKDYQSFTGDNPRRPELVKINGSFKHGRDGDKGGIFFPASVHAGQFIVEEFSLGNAEDVTKVLSTTYRYGQNADLDTLVPQQLAQRLCSGGDCIVTKNYSLLEPDTFARKYYSRGIGFFLEIKPDTKDVLQLVNCNFDSRCVGLPTP
jgi:hypothetical protein